MVDYYALPGNFPGLAALPRKLAATDRVTRLEAGLHRDLAKRLDDLPVSGRFIPYIQLHEFEALLFSVPTAFLEAFPNHSKAVAQLTAIRARFEDPEAIDDNPHTAPSKRILNLLPDYQKPVAGLLIAQRIGLDAIRHECQHFDAWVTRLLALADPT
jgi:hypothetical protein